MEGRSLYVHKEGTTTLPVLAEGGAFYVRCAMPIITEGDVVGCVASVSDRPVDERQDSLPGGEVETKLILTAAGFLGKQLES
jgi:AbrB family transcriptional regulator (stage V sporulation protein T)